MSVYEKTYKTFVSAVKKHSLIPEGSHILLGLSGGVDSIVLFHFLCRYQKEHTFTLSAARMMYGWGDRFSSRTEEEKEEEKLCEQLCKECKVPFYKDHASNFYSKDSKSKGSTEAQGREARRTWFEDLAKKHSFTRIALAHHADDQMETFFIRLIRGAGIEGLGCMKYYNDPYIRPLLDMLKDELYAVAHEQKWQWCEDSSNKETSLLRNNIRSSLLPVYKKIDERASGSLLKCIEKLQSTQRLLEEYLKGDIDKFFDVSSYSFNTKVFLQFSDDRQKQLVHKTLVMAYKGHITSALVDEIIRFLKNKKSTSHKIENVIFTKR